MEASSVTRRALARGAVRNWAWWSLPLHLRIYVGIPPLAALVFGSFAATQTTWHATDVVKYMVLLGCGLISVVATPRIAFLEGGLARDFLTVWVLPVSILLPPVYAMITPAPLLLLTQLRVHRGVVYRRVFTVGSMACSYGMASLVFHALPASFAGDTIGTGRHALTWVLAVAACELMGWLGHQAPLVTAIKLSDPTARFAKLVLDPEALEGDFAQIDLGIVMTIIVAVNPALALVGVPTVLLARRFMMHAPLMAKSRIDPKTGLLNAITWESEAAAEIARAQRTRSPVALALVDIDHFKQVNDTHGHLAGDIALRAVTDAIRQHLRSYDLAGRFGGEEFVVLLPQAHASDAWAIAERLREHIEDMAIPIDKAKPGEIVRLTVSIGLASLDPTMHELTDLLAVADTALYQAKQDGRNRTHAGSTEVRQPAVPSPRSAPTLLPEPRLPEPRLPEPRLADLRELTDPLDGQRMPTSETPWP